MERNRLLTLLVLLVTAVMAAWAQSATYQVDLNDGTKNPTTWTGKAGDATQFSALPLEGVAEGQIVTLKYSGTREVKSIKTKKPAATVTTPPQATTGDIMAGSTTALVNAGAADGGTMMYAVTTTNTQPTSTGGFSATVPTAESITSAGTVYVWYYVKGDANHSDSEIAGPVNVTVKTVITWNASTLNSMSMYFMSGSQSKTSEGITVTATANGEPMQFADPINVNGSGYFTFTTSAGNISKIEITHTYEGTWNNANAGWPQEYNAFDGGTFTWSGTPAQSVTLSGDGGASLFGVTSIVFTIE